MKLVWFGVVALVVGAAAQEPAEQEFQYSLRDFIKHLMNLEKLRDQEAETEFLDAPATSQQQQIVYDEPDPAAFIGAEALQHGNVYSVYGDKFESEGKSSFHARPKRQTSSSSSVASSVPQTDANGNRLSTFFSNVTSLNDVYGSAIGTRALRTKRETQDHLAALLRPIHEMFGIVDETTRAVFKDVLPKDRNDDPSGVKLVPIAQPIFVPIQFDPSRFTQALEKAAMPFLKAFANLTSELALAVRETAPTTAPEVPFLLASL
ncbi:unnamed protein product [Notodromas monacha]|uniref:Uncharacterized protein n=1 Tax=Notodromas monacha TaxID=399045 RepID=A0A7R9BWH4_9CRUS|nr:unnamed protein product [Notodromas monacha]CAG0921674.1 unnamed protein product [Notodromas monacha]